MASQASPYPPRPSSTDDIKYLAKYKDMKRKVRQIELENDRLHLKCLKARKNIGRLRLERGILYERLATMPAGEPRPHQVDAQEYYGQSPFQPNIQARMQERDHRSPVDAQAPVHLLTAAQGQFLRYPEQPPPMTLGVPIQVDPPAAKPRPQKHESSAVSPPLPPPTISFQETWKPSPRTYPFVLEYQQQTHESTASPGRAQPATAYPSEIRFHQYDTSERPAHRSRRDFDRDTEKTAGIPYKVRPPELDRDYRVGHADSQSRSPGPASSSSSQGGPAYSLLPSLEREARPQQRRDQEAYRDSHPPQNDPGPHSEERQRRGVDTNGIGQRNSHTYHDRHDLDHPRQHPEDAARHLPPTTKRTFSQFDQEHRDRVTDNDFGQRDGQYDHKRVYRGRDVEDERHAALPRVREGEVVD